MRFIARRDRAEHPSGDFDNAKRWWPDDDEDCDCCTYIRTPSRSWPHSLIVHCCTAEHVANLHGVSVKALRRVARELDKEYEIDDDELLNVA